MNVLVTGATGFVGSHLCEYLLRQGEEVHGTFIYPHELDLLPPEFRQQIILHPCDLAQSDAMRGVVAAVRPERIYHLAAISSVHKSWEGREQVLRVNLFGWLNLLETVLEYCPESRILMVSSGEVYGNVPESQQPVSETCSMQPLNPYAASKSAQELFCYQYIHAYRLPVVIVRPFNHTGPRQSPNFVCPDFAKQIAEIERGVRAPVISVGNLEARRDFLDVHDVVRAYHLALEQCPVGAPFNIASGQAWAIQDILDTLINLSTTTIEVRQDANRLRPSDVSLMLGEARMFQQHTGWQPDIDFAATLRSVLDYWRQQVAA